jgi:hypothetical protein
MPNSDVDEAVEGNDEEEDEEGCSEDTVRLAALG